MANAIERARKYVRNSYAKAQGISGTQYGFAGKLSIYEESGALEHGGTTTFGGFTSSSASHLEKASMSARKGERISYQKTLIGSADTLPSGTAEYTCTDGLEVECDIFEFQWNLSGNVVFMCNAWRLSGISGSSMVAFGTSGGTACVEDNLTPTCEHFKYFSTAAATWTAQIAECGQQIDPDLGTLNFETAEIMCMTGVPWKSWKSVT